MKTKREKAPDWLRDLEKNPPTKRETMVVPITMSRDDWWAVVQDAKRSRQSIGKVMSILLRQSPDMVDLHNRVTR